jgi:hypothetical protein
MTFGSAIRRVTSCALIALSLISCGGGSGGPEKDLTIGFAYIDRDLELYQSFSANPQISGLEGNRPSCRVVSGDIPEGLVVNSDCTVSGRTVKPTITSAVVELTVAGFKGSVTSNLRLSVQRPTLSRANGSNGGDPIDHAFDAGRPVSQRAVSVTKFTPSTDRSLAFRITSGILPRGVTLDRGTGALAGRADDIGDFKFSIGAALTSGADSFELNEVQLNVRLSYSYVFSSYQTLASPNVGTELNQTVETNYVPISGSTVQYSVIQGALAAGLSLNPETGRILGTLEMPKYGDGEFVNTLVQQRIATSNGQQLDRFIGAGLTLEWPRVFIVERPFLYPGLTFSGERQFVKASLPGDVYRFSLRLKPNSTFSGNVLRGVVPAWLKIEPTTGSLSGEVPASGARDQYELELVLSVERNGRSFVVYNPFNISY